MHIPDIIIAIDGYSSTGKSSFARLIAKESSFLYLDSGALYRAVTYYALEHGLISDDGTIDKAGLVNSLGKIDIDFRSGEDGSHIFIGGECIDSKIRTMRVSSVVSPVAAIPEVRKFVDSKLTEFGKKGRVVMDGRDIGTSVFPNADLKIFMVADDRVRAERRFKEMKEAGMDTDIETVLRNLKDRDFIDTHRDSSPLRQASDAIVLDNTHMTIEEQMEWIRDLISKRFHTEDGSKS